MDVEQINEKYSTKNLLFYRAIPPYVNSEPTNGHKLYNCIDCGDRFTLETSYNDHINRKSLKISFTCRRCSSSVQQQVFYNRCNLLSHIRSHSFKTASINVSDLNIEPLPINCYKLSDLIVDIQKQQQQQQHTVPLENSAEIAQRIVCVECNDDITLKDTPSKDRVSHYMKYTNRFHSCPVCLLTLPTLCALKSHLRVHLKNPPYFCPECGAQLPNEVVNYPFSHGCEGFNMMRATVRLECPVPKCQSSLFHPQDYKKHLKLDHLKKVFKCPYCVVACFSEATIYKHLESHNSKQNSNLNNILIFYQCEMCPGRLVLQNHLESHVNTHVNDNVYPCWTCGTRFKNIHLLIDHHINSHMTNHAMMEDLKNALKASLGFSGGTKYLKKKMFRVVKRCDQCLRRFSYKCLYDDIKILPNACPYKCTPTSKSLLLKSCNDSISTNIVCPLCKKKIDKNWDIIKRHFASEHKNHKCLDGKIILTKIDLKIRRKRQKKGTIAIPTKTKRVTNQIQAKKQNNITAVVKSTPQPDHEFVCVKCQRQYKSKNDLENHVIDHRDPYMAYQCLECGECFVVKPSFSTHLLVKHGISDVDDYIERKQCYNNDALITCQEVDCDIPLEENQCKICKERFEDSDELEKHFRVHGMAFLKKNSQHKCSV